MRDPRRTLPALVPIVVSAGLLTWVALYNGFPLIYSDSAGYLSSAVEGYVFWARSFVYSLFLYALHWGVSPWPIVFGQGLILSHLLHLTVRALRPRTTSLEFVGLITGLSALTSLSWFASWILPDFFAAVTIVGLYLLGFVRDRLARWERVSVISLVALAAASHASLVPLSIGMVPCLLALRVLSGPRPASVPRWLAWMLLPAVLGAAATLTVHRIDRGQWTLVPNSQFFVLARLIEDGPAVDFLERNCPDPRLSLCDHLSRLPMQEWKFLWLPDSPLHEAGGFEALAPEAAAIVRGTLADDPVRVVTRALRDAAVQFVTIRLTDELQSYRDDDRVISKLRIVFPGSLRAFERSRQSRSALPVTIFSWIQVLTVLGAIPLLVASLAVLARRRQPAPARLTVAVLIGLAGNAFLTGPLSEVVGRYQSRVIWLLPFVAALAALCAFRNRR